MRRSTRLPGSRSKLFRRRLFLETLEDRRLLAALPYHYPVNPYDVNVDGIADGVDAWHLNEALSAGERALADPNGPVQHFVDVSGDNHLSALDDELLLRYLTGTLNDRSDAGQSSGSASDGQASELDSGGGMGMMSCPSITLNPVTAVNEGSAFSLTGSVSPPGMYFFQANVNWGQSPGNTGMGTVGTDSGGGFSIPHIYFDDGPAPGNGTPQDIEPISLTATINGCAVEANTTATINNTPPVPQLSLVNTNQPYGGPRWQISGTIQDASMSERHTITINWGDGSPVTVVSDLPTNTQFSREHEYDPRQIHEGPLPYYVTVSVVDDDTGAALWEPIVPQYVLDLDNDANNNRAIEPADDPIEGFVPGRYLAVNTDDDNMNDIPDKDEEGPIAGEDDLEQLLIGWEPRTDFDYTGWHIVLTMDPEPLLDQYGNYVSDLAKFYTSSNKTELLEFEQTVAGSPGFDWVIGTEAVPPYLYIEALNGSVGSGTVISVLESLHTPQGFLADDDEVFFTSKPGDVDVDLMIYDGQFGDPIPDADEDITGAVTVANLNDTDADTQPDCCDVDGVVEDRILDDAHGRNEVDLMRLEAYRPKGYVAGTLATLTVNDPDNVFLWKESTKKNGVELGPGGTLSITWAAGEGERKEYWVEVVAPSETVANYTFTLSYGGKSDVVKATAVWADNTATYLETTDWESVPADPWKTEMEQGQQDSAIFVGGTGVRPPRAVDDKLLFANKVFFQYTVTPTDVVEKLPRVQFDATRQKEGKIFVKTAEGEIEIYQPGNSVLNPKYPVKWEEPNDDPNNDLEYPVHNDTGHMYHGDRPSVNVPAEPPETDPLEFYIRRNFWEWIRVRFKQGRPSGNTIQGSQSSDSFLWHSRITIDRATGEWKRVGVNDIDGGHVVIGDQP